MSVRDADESDRLTMDRTGRLKPGPHCPGNYSAGRGLSGESAAFRLSRDRGRRRKPSDGVTDLPARLVRRAARAAHGTAADTTPPSGPARADPRLRRRT
jgi:hypothetical protein